MSAPETRDSGAGTMRQALAEPAVDAVTVARVDLASVPSQARGTWVRADDQADVDAVATMGVRLAADQVDVVLAGELDLAIAPAITRTVRDLLTAGHHHIIVNLDAVTFLDGTILGVLIRAHRDVTSAGGSLELTAHPLCDRLLEVTGMTSAFTAATR